MAGRAAERVPVAVPVAAVLFRAPVAEAVAVAVPFKAPVAVAVAVPFNPTEPVAVELAVELVSPVVPLNR